MSPSRAVTANTDLAQRYGTDRGRRPVLVALVAVVVVASLAWLVWAMLFHSRPVVTSDLLGFSEPGAHFVDAEVRVVRRSADVTATCLLRAQSADHAIVGELSFTIDDSEPATSVTTQTIRTERKATAVSLLGCSSPPDQPQRR